MIKIKSKILLGLAIITSVSFFACEEAGDNDPQISKHGDDESHYTGYNCMNCHYNTGSGEGWFSVAGTVDGAYQRALVELYSGPDGTGTLLGLLEVDDKRNFFSTDMIDFTNGVYVATNDGDGNREYMEGQIFNGGCNLCHGETTGELIIE
jgi:hypothetical protein